MLARGELERGVDLGPHAGDESLGAEAAVALGHAAIRVDHEERRQSRDAVGERGGVGVEQAAVGDGLLLDHAPRGDWVGLAGVEAEDDDPALGRGVGLVGRVEFLEKRHRALAGAAPRRPEVEDHDLAAEGGERDFLSIEVLEGEVGRDRADLDEATRCGRLRLLARLRLRVAPGLEFGGGRHGEARGVDGGIDRDDLEVVVDRRIEVRAVEAGADALLEAAGEAVAARDGVGVDRAKGHGVLVALDLDHGRRGDGLTHEVARLSVERLLARQFVGRAARLLGERREPEGPEVEDAPVERGGGPGFRGREFAVGLRSLVDGHRARSVADDGDVGVPILDTQLAWRREFGAKRAPDVLVQRVARGARAELERAQARGGGGGRGVCCVGRGLRRGGRGLRGVDG